MDPDDSWNHSTSKENRASEGQNRSTGDLPVVVKTGRKTSAQTQNVSIKCSLHGTPHLHSVRCISTDSFQGVSVYFWGWI